MMRFSSSQRWVLVLVLAQLIAGICHAAERPRLVVQLTVDQLRGDMLPRLRERFGSGGFRRLMDQGLYFDNAHYGTGNTFTASGHAVLVTGANTAEHGMVANEWFDRESGKMMYSTFDPTHGLSPANLTSTTLSDELVSASGGKARAFSIAGKDRSAIIPGGHRGKAFWFLEKDGTFATSTYYYEKAPDWVSTWNNRKEFEKYKGAEWKRAPHPIANPFARPKTTLSFTPFLDNLTASFARELVLQEKLGQLSSMEHSYPDYLAISFSGTDYIGHAYGPNSAEYEDNLLHLDQTLAGLLSFLDKTIGKDRTLIVLSADHGVDDIPEERHLLGFNAGRFYPKKLLDQLNATLRTRLSLSADPIVAFVPPGFYLKQRNPQIEEALAEELRKVPGVAYAYSRSQLLAGQLAHTPILDKVQRGFHPTRSGDVIIVQEQFWYLYTDAEAFAAMHGSPYSYDTFVPVIFSGAGIRHATVRRPIEPASIAPTLASWLHIKPPSGNTAVVLPEVVGAVRDQ